MGIKLKKKGYRRRAMPASAIALGIAGVLGVSATPIATAQPGVESAVNKAASAVMDTPGAKKALQALRELQGSDETVDVSGLVANGQPMDDFIKQITTDPQSLESLAVSVVSDNNSADNEVVSMLMTVTDTDGRMSVSQLDDLDAGVATSLAEMVTELAAEITNTAASQDSMDVEPSTKISTLSENLEALAGLGGHSGAVDINNVLNESVFTEVESRLANFAGNNNTGGNKTELNVSETTVNISFDNEGDPSPQARVKTNDGTQVTQAQAGVNASQVDRLISVLTALDSAQDVTKTQSLVQDLISAVEQSNDAAGIEKKLTNLLNEAALSSGGEAQQAKVSEENGLLVQALTEILQKRASGETVSVKNKTNTISADDGLSQLVKTLREAIAAEMDKAGFDAETIEAITGVSKESGQVVVNINISQQGGDNPSANDDDALGRIAEALAKLLENNGDKSGADNKASGLADKLSQAKTEEELAEVLKGLSADELTSLAGMLESTDTSKDKGSAGGEASKSSTGSDNADRDEATRELIQAVLKEAPSGEAAIKAAANSTSPNNSDTNAKKNNAAKKASDEGQVVEKVVVVAEDEKNVKEGDGTDQQQVETEQLAVTGSNSTTIVGVLATLGVTVLVLIAGAVWWQRRRDFS